MNILLRAVTIIDQNSPHHLKQKDIFIENGKVSVIGKKPDTKDKFEELDCKGLMISPGWFDMYSHFCDPGYEYKEDLKSGAKSAAAGGFTGVAVLPDTLPSVHSKSEVEYIRNKTKGNIIDVFPVGAVTRKCEGTELAEIYDMYKSGAVAFSDAEHPVMNSGVMMRALLYARQFNGVIFSHPDDESVSHGGSMNEGVTSTNLGLKGMPAIAEELLVVRDIYLAEYTNSRVHFSCISTKRSVELIREAKKRGVKVTTGVNAINLLFDDSELNSFDSNYKINPPLRTKEDIKALKAGLKDRTIDVIVSGHQPQNTELKEVEYEYAAFGAINLQTSFAIANTVLNKTLTPEQLIDKLAIQPRKILNLKIPVVKEGEEANFTIFSPDAEWKLTVKEIKSKSKNTPLIGKTLTGKPVAIINNNQFYKN